MVRPKTDEGRIRRQVVLSLIRSYVREHGFPPSQPEISARTGIPNTTLRWHLNSLRDQGFLRWEDGAMGRTLKVTRKDPEKVQ